MRERITESGGLTTVGYYFRRVREAAEVPFNDSYVPTSPFGRLERKAVVDVGPIPGFWKVCKQKGILPMHAFDISTRVEEIIPGRINKTDTSYGTNHPPFISKIEIGEWTSDLLDNGVYGFLPVPEIPTSAYNDVMTRAAARAMEPDWDALTFIAEAGDLQRRVVSILLFLRKLFKRMKLELAANLRKYYTDKEWRERKRSKRELKRFRDGLSLEGLWLQYRYEVMPLISDFQSALETFEKKGVQNFTRKGKAIAEFPVELSNTDVLVRDWSATDMVVQTVRGTISVRSTAIGRTLSLRPAAWGSVLTTAWELVSLSFVVDWFVDVGSWLSTLAYSGDVDIVAQCVSVKTDLEFEVWSSRVYAGKSDDTPTRTETTGSCTPHVHRVKVTRYQRWPDSPSGLPSWNPRITTLRLLDAAALLAVFTGGSRKHIKGSNS